MINKHCVTTAWLLLSLWIAPNLALGDEDENLRRILSPTPESVEASEAVPAKEIFGWMKAIEVSLATTDWDYSATCEVASRFSVNGKSSVAVESLVLRCAVCRDLAAKRIIISTQNLLANEAISKNSGDAIDTTKSLDYIEIDGVAAVDRVVSSVAPVEAVDVGEPSDFIPTLRRKKFFHPCRAAVIGVRQVLAGYAMRFEGHSVLPQTIRGSVTIGPYTHVLLRIGTTNQMVTFVDECPVQFESWEKIDPTTKKAICHEVTRTLWRELADGVKRPVKISAIRQHRVSPSDLTAEISWRIGEKVDRSIFDEASIGYGMISAHHESERSLTR